MSLADYEDPWAAPPRPTVFGPVTPPSYSFTPAKALPLDSEPGCWAAPELFFSETPSETTERIQEAKTLCRRCPVREACLELGKDEREGIWGGLTPHERRHPGRRRKPVPAPVPQPASAPAYDHRPAWRRDRPAPPPAPAPEPVDDRPLAVVIPFPMDRVRPHPPCSPNVDSCEVCFPDG